MAWCWLSMVPAHRLQMHDTLCKRMCKRMTLSRLPSQAMFGIVAGMALTPQAHQPGVQVGAWAAQVANRLSYRLPVPHMALPSG